MKTKTLNLLWAVLLGVTLSACSGDDNGGTTTTPTTPTTPTPGSTATTVGNVDLTATRSTIAVGGELVTLTANVTDPGGTLPVVGRTVTFTASGASSTLSPASAETDDSGAASTTLTSGDVAGTVTVTATIAGVSGSVEVQINLGTPGPSFPSTGIPDQNSFSIAVDTLNPEGFDFDGESATVTVRLADHLNGTGVADGTLVRFSTEGGRIEPFCETSGGTCSVQWESSDPRPADGRSAILAWTLGNESFVDLDSDGVLNGNDVFDTADINDATPGNDVPEGFRDDNHNGVYDAASEEFPAEHPTSDDGIYDFGDNEYNGVSCEDIAGPPPVKCSSNQLVTIWRQGSIDVSASTTNASR